MNLAFAAQSGWGKSYYSQAWMEENFPDYDYGLILDFKDEYRGLVKHGLAKHLIGGPDELAWSVDTWEKAIKRNGVLDVGRLNSLTVEEWRELAARAVSAARRLPGSVLIAIDEAHFVAPQTGKLPAPIKGLATTGRGEGASSVWITQRLSEIDETILAQCQARLLGGFESSADLDKVKKIIEYPVDLHNPQSQKVRNVAEELCADGDAPTKPLQKFTDEDDNVTGSEWIYSDNSGDRERLDTSDVDMASTHYGAQGETLRKPTHS